MSDYVVNVNDPTTPTEQQAAKHGAEELRAIKALLVSLIVAGSASAAPRQTVVNALKDASGYNNALSAGAGLRVQLTANATDPYQLSYAAGFANGLAINSGEQIAANNADIIGADLPLSNTSFLYRTYGATYGSTLVPPQYGYTFDRSRGAILNFEGNDGTVVINDDFGNTWAANGNAQIDTAQFKFGTSSLLVDGAGDTITTTNINSFGDSSWEFSFWTRRAALPGVESTLLNAANAAGFGLTVNMAAAGTLRFYASSNGTAWDIANGTAGAAVLAVNQWHKIRVVFDALGGTYRIYTSVNGAAETQDISVASTNRVCAFSGIAMGGTLAGAQYIAGWFDAFQFIACATKTAIENPAIVAPTITDHRYHFFSIPDMKMYEATAASAGAGQNPTLTATTRLFLGEADTSGVAVTAVRNYAIRGKYVTTIACPAAGSTTARSHNLGHTAFVDTKITAICVTDNTGYKVGYRTEVFSIQVGGGTDYRSYPSLQITGRNTFDLVSGSDGLIMGNKLTGAVASIGGSSTQFLLELCAQRSF